MFCPVDVEKWISKTRFRFEGYSTEFFRISHILNNCSVSWSAGWAGGGFCRSLGEESHAMFVHDLAGAMHNVYAERTNSGNTEKCCTYDAVDGEMGTTTVGESKNDGAVAPRSTMMYYSDLGEKLNSTGWMGGMAGIMGYM